MSGLNDLVRKLKHAVTGADDDPRAAKPFHWEPAAATPAAPAPIFKEAMPREAKDPVPAEPAGSRRAGIELPSVIGSSIPADVADFATVYRGASVQAPPHEYGVDRIASMLEHKSLAGLDKGVKASAVLAALDAAGVQVKDVIHDGLLRYKALVAFEAAKELELHQLRPRNDRRIEELRAGNEAFQKKKQAEIDGLSRESAAAQASLSRLKSRQRAEQERFHRTLSLFVEPLPGRVIPMQAKPAEPAAAAPAPAPAAEAKPDLKLVVPNSAADATISPAPGDSTMPVPAPAKPEEPKS